MVSQCLKYYSLIVLLLMTASAKADDYNPIKIFSPVFVPALSGFETTKIITFTRGFALRGDSFSGMKESTEIPSAYGIFLRVSLHDEGPNAKARDVITNAIHHSDITGDNPYKIRRITLPQHSTNEASLEIEFSYGASVGQKTFALINSVIEQAGSEASLSNLHVGMTPQEVAPILVREGWMAVSITLFRRSSSMGHRPEYLGDGSSLALQYDNNARLVRWKLEGTARAN